MDYWQAFICFAMDVWEEQVNRSNKYYHPNETQQGEVVIQDMHLPDEMEIGDLLELLQFLISKMQGVKKPSPVVLVPELALIQMWKKGVRSLAFHPDGTYLDVALTEEGQDNYLWNRRWSKLHHN